MKQMRIRGIELVADYEGGDPQKEGEQLLKATNEAIVDFDSGPSIEYNQGLGGLDIEVQELDDDTGEVIRTLKTV